MGPLIFSYFVDIWYITISSGNYFPPSLYVYTQTCGNLAQTVVKRWVLSFVQWATNKWNKNTFDSPTGNSDEINVIFTTMYKVLLFFRLTNTWRLMAKRREKKFNNIKHLNRVLIKRRRRRKKTDTKSTRRKKQKEKKKRERKK